MSLFGWSDADITDAIKIAQNLWGTCFDKDGRAVPRCVELGKSVDQFGKLLERFRARSQALVKELCDINGEWNTNILRGGPEVIGSFTQTLKDCQQLLERHTKHLSRNVKVLENAKWNNYEADILRQRLLIHAAKINLLITLDANAILHAVQNNMEDLPAQNYDQSGIGPGKVLPEVPPVLDKLYSQALDINPPSTYNGVETFPLAEGLDALVVAFNTSSARSLSRYSSLDLWTPTPEEMNNLIKARWIFGCICSSGLLRSCSPLSTWACALEAVLKNLQKEYSRWQQILDQNTEKIANLQSESYQIWPPTEIIAVDLTTDLGFDHLEEKILEVPLQTIKGQFKESLIVLRRPGNEFLLLKYTKLNSTDSDSAILPSIKHFKVHSAQIIPQFRLSPNRSNSQDIGGFELCYPGKGFGELYNFLDVEDRHNFQHALLGYKVVFQDTCDWYLHQPTSIQALKGTGIVQIFQPKTMQPSNYPQSGGNVSLNPRNRHNSTVSNASIRTASSRASTHLSTFRSGGAMISRYPDVPLIVIFTEIDGQKTFLRIELNYKVKVRPKLCDCSSQNVQEKKSCRTTVFKSSSAFPIRRFSASSKPEWNMSLLCLPKHPDFENKMKGVSYIQYLKLKTSVLASEFQEIIDIATQLHNNEKLEYHTTDLCVRKDAERKIPSWSLSMTGLPLTMSTVQSISSASEPSNSAETFNMPNSPVQEVFGGPELDDKPMPSSSMPHVSSKLANTSRPSRKMKFWKS